MGKHGKRLAVRIVLLVAVAAAWVVAGEVQPAAARWTKKENWRQRLKVGMSPQAVKQVLGEPAYEEYGVSVAIFYYQTSSKTNIIHPGPVNAADGKSPKEYLANSGMVIFSLKGTPTVKAWDEPAWKDIPSPAPGERPARKAPVPCRKLDQWEVDKNWRRLSVDIDQRAVQRMLGRPTKDKENEFATRTTESVYVEWEYGTGNAKGWLKFSGPKKSPKGGLKCYEWKEPFWPVVEATFCPDPNAASGPSADDKAKADKK